MVSVATKPGVSAHGTVDPAAMMLAEWIAEHPSQIAEPRSLHLACGNGVVPAMARAMGYAVTACDRLAPNVQATLRTLGDDADVRHAALPDVDEGAVHLATIRLPTDRVSAQLAGTAAFRALRPGGTLAVAGANDEGIKPLARFLEQAGCTVRLDAQHSGHRLLTVTRDEGVLDIDTEVTAWMAPAHWRELPVTLGGESFTCVSRPGVFSWEHLDEATTVLGEVLETHPVPPGARVLDLGCGSGALGVLAARQSCSGRVVLVDADAEAVRCARETLRRAGCDHAVALASDVTSAVMDERFDVVVSNPPFHVGKATDLEVPRAFIASAHAVLAPGGVLRLVANRTLPYERWIAETFGSVETLHDGRRFKVLGAIRR